MTDPRTRLYGFAFVAALAVAGCQCVKPAENIFACDSRGGCDPGYQCVNGKGIDGMTKIEQCTPKDASCSCLARGDFNQPCSNVNGFGSGGKRSAPS